MRFHILTLSLAASLLAGADRRTLSEEDRKSLDSAITEYRTWLNHDADRAESLASLAALQAAEGDVAAIDDDSAVHEQATNRGILGVVEHHRIVRDPLTRLGEDPHVGRIWSERRPGGLAAGVGGRERRDQINDELQVIGMNELHAVTADQRLIAENSGERRRVPQDHELLVEQQRELTFGAANRCEAASRRTVHL